MPAAAFGAGQLQALLDDPEMQTLIVAAPAAGRPLPAEPRRAEPSRDAPRGPHRAPPPAQAIGQLACGPPMPA